MPTFSDKIKQGSTGNIKGKSLNLGYATVNYATKRTFTNTCRNPDGSLKQKCVSKHLCGGYNPNNNNPPGCNGHCVSINTTPNGKQTCQKFTYTCQSTPSASNCKSTNVPLMSQCGNTQCAGNCAYSTVAGDTLYVTAMAYV